MDLPRCFVLLFLAAFWAQAQPDEPRAVVNGKPVSLSELEPLFGSLPPELRSNPEQIFLYYGFLDRMAAKGEAAKLFEQSPYKEQILLARKQVLAQAAMDQFTNDLDISDAELKEYYEKHKDDFSIATVQSLLIPVKSREEEAGAAAKARQLSARIKDGAELAGLLAQYPGDLTSIRKGDPRIAAAIRTAVLALHPGEVSSPLVQPNGVYLIRLQNVATPEFQDALATVRRTVTDARFNEWIAEVQKSVTVTKTGPHGGN
jgi:parvulin-like peptidyl-prolyl isomerase